jgi:hypothetical protein
MDLINAPGDIGRGVRMIEGKYWLEESLVSDTEQWVRFAFSHHIHNKRQFRLCRTGHALVCANLAAACSLFA